jgi:hypothetical protein
MGTGGNAFRKLQAGQRLKAIPAKAWNAFLDAAAKTNTIGPPGAADGSGLTDNRSIVLVQNNSGYTVPSQGILGIDSILISPADNAESFLLRPGLSCVTPTAAHLGRFVVLLEPARDGAIVRGVLGGVVQVKVSMVESGQKWADVLDGDATQLESGNVGTAQILYVESGTGTKWALVRLGVLPGVVVVKVTGSESGGGKYTGRVLAWGGAPAVTGDLAESDVGGVPAADDALIENLNEVGQSTHTLTDASNTYEKLFLGSVRGITDDGRWAVAINGFFGGCESS